MIETYDNISLSPYSHFTRKLKNCINTNCLLGFFTFILFQTSFVLKRSKSDYITCKSFTMCWCIGYKNHSARVNHVHHKFVTMVKKRKAAVIIWVTVSFNNEMTYTCNTLDEVRYFSIRVFIYVNHHRPTDNNPKKQTYDTLGRLPVIGDIVEAIYRYL
eukprot:Pompholyxophrys_sp_v1_NODE_9_length_5690_cov_16.428039.p2 type:complete len:159 gc:universal NODE_9_length_5690_cov_16.428039:2586-3062(+)